jgi:hypothetical protein
MPRTLGSPLGQMIDRRGLRRDYVAAVLNVQPWTLSRILRHGRADDTFWAAAAYLLECDEAEIRPARCEVAA